MIVGLFIVITWLNVTNQYLNICNYYIDANTYFHDILFNTQKMLFNNLLGIMLCIYINTYDINRTEYVIREKDKILSAQIFLGCKICAVYSFTVLAFITLPLLHFVSHKIMVLFFIYWIRLFAFNFLIFIIFTFFSIFIRRVISMFLILAIGFMLLVSWNIYDFKFLNNDTFFVTQNIWFHVGMIISLILICSHFLKNKEYIT